MSLHQMTGLTPHLTEPDLAHLRGHEVLGEPLEVLMSVALQLRFTPTDGGMTRVDFDVPTEEADALRRAMTKVDAPDVLSPDEQDVHRIMVVLTQTSMAADAVIRRLLAQSA